MIQHRGILCLVFLSGLVAVAGLFPAAPVEASTTSDSAIVATSVDGGRNHLSGHDLALLQAGVLVAPQDAPLPEGKGKDLVQQKCSSCHTSTVWIKKHYTEDQWSSIMDQMVEKGMKASDDEITTMTSYLAANFGPVKKDTPPPAPPAPPQ